MVQIINVYLKIINQGWHGRIMNLRPIREAQHNATITNNDDIPKFASHACFLIALGEWRQMRVNIEKDPTNRSKLGVTAALPDWRDRKALVQGLWGQSREPMPTESKGEVSLEGSRRNGSDKLDVVEGITCLPVLKLLLWTPCLL